MLFLLNIKGEAAPPHSPNTNPKIFDFVLSVPFLHHLSANLTVMFQHKHSLLFWVENVSSGTYGI